MNRCEHNRNYACRIREYVFRGLRTVTLENELLRVTVLADKGTDIVELLHKSSDTDVMWHSFNAPRSPGSFAATRAEPRGAFLDFYSGGWQELFPSIGDDCVYLGAPLGTHGEASLLPWDYRIEQDVPETVSVTFRVRTVRTPYLLEKTLTLRSNEPVLVLEETVTNEGTEELQFMWGHHPALGPLFLDGRCRVEVPGPCRARTVPFERGKHWALPRDVEFEWPNVKGLDGRMWDLSRVPSPEDRVYLMYYLYDLPRGQYSVLSPSRGVRFTLRWDRELFPILWVWAPCGGADGYPWYGRTYTVAMEPWSAVPGNLAEVAEQGRGIRIAAGQTISTRLEAALTAAAGASEAMS